MEQLSMRVVWRFAGMKPGALCVMGSGQDLMHKWPADSLVTWQMVQDTYKRYYWIAYLYFACPSLNWNLWWAPHAALMVVFMNCLYRSNSTLQCLLWSGNWSHPPGWLDLHKHWISTSGLPTWWNWSVWLLQGPSGWCWSQMCRKWVIYLQNTH